MPDARARIAALVGNHTVLRDGRPVPVWQAVGAHNVEQIAATVHDDVVAPVEAERVRLIRRLRDSVGDDVADLMLAIDDCVIRAERAEAERDTARAVLADIRDRHHRHGDRCNGCGTKHPCWHWRTATRALGQEET